MSERFKTHSVAKAIKIFKKNKLDWNSLSMDEKINAIGMGNQDGVIKIIILATGDYSLTSLLKNTTHGAVSVENINSTMDYREYTLVDDIYESAFIHAHETAGRYELIQVDTGRLLKVYIFKYNGKTFIDRCGRKDYADAKIKDFQYKLITDNYLKQVYDIITNNIINSIEMDNQIFELYHGTYKQELQATFPQLNFYGLSSGPADRCMVCFENTTGIGCCKAHQCFECTKMLMELNSSDINRVKFRHCIICRRTLIFD